MNMLDDILADEFEVTPATNQPFLDTANCYDELVERYQAAAKQFGEAKKKGEFSDDLSAWMEEKSVKDPKSSRFTPAKNYQLLKNETDSRLRNGSKLTNISIEITDLDRSLYELSESIENARLIQDNYRLRKQCTRPDGGINLEEAAKIKHCFSQGRELYRSGTVGSLIVKPLNYFYAITAYAYGIILLNNPLRYRKDMLPGSHGINYEPESIQIQFGGDMPRGTFSDLHSSFPQNLIKTSELELTGSSLSSICSFYEQRVTCSLGTLLSMVPEMGDFFRIATGQDSRTHPLAVKPSTQITDPSPTFVIGNGVLKPDMDRLARSFPEMQIEEVRGQVHISVPADRISEIRASIYSDIQGKLWYIDNPFEPIQMPELCLHFLILSMFSNIMRYRPDEWGGLVDNDVSANVSLAARHYFSVIERKFNCIILRETSAFFPYAEGGW